MIKVSIAITLPTSIREQLDKARGLVSRSAYIREAIERYLGRTCPGKVSKDLK